MTIDRFSTRFAGDAFPDDGSPEDVLAGDEARLVWEATAPHPIEPHTHTFLAQLRARVAEEGGRRPHPAVTHARLRTPQQTPRARYVTLAIAGLACAALVTTSVRRVSTRDAATVSAQGHVYTTTTGQRSVVMLSDGSRMTLAPRTRATITSDADARTVTLDGHAYFEIAPNTRTPFLVRTGTVVTRVLGTAFDVRHYTGDPSVRVVVTSGKVASGGRRSQAILTAGAVAHVTDSTAVTAPADDLESLTSWTTGQLTFDDMPASTVLDALSRWYGLTFRLADSSIAARHVTASFNTARRSNTLAELADLLGVSMTTHRDTVTLAPRRPDGVTRTRTGRDMQSLSTEVGK